MSRAYRRAFASGLQLVAFSAGLFLAAASCKRHAPPQHFTPQGAPDPSTKTTGEAGTSFESEERTALPAAFGPREAGRLEAPGFLPAPLFVPRGGERSAPMRVAFFAHGAGGRGIDHCLFWDPHMPRDYVLVCPAGALLDRRIPDGGSYFPDHLKLRAELIALVDALRQRFGSTVVQEGFRYVGYSQGATMGALAIVGEVDFFKELVLIEGGGENWSARRSQQFKEYGGERVLLSCGTAGCIAHAGRSVPILVAAGLDVGEAHAPGVGHTYGGGVGRAVLAKMAEWD